MSSKEPLLQIEEQTLVQSLKGFYGVTLLVAPPLAYKSTTLIEAFSNCHSKISPAPREIKNIVMTHPSSAL